MHRAAPPVASSSAAARPTRRFAPEPGAHRAGTPRARAGSARLRRAAAAIAVAGASLTGLTGLAGLAGCAAPGVEASAGQPAIADDFVRSRLVAADFVDVMSQLPELAPARTQLSTPAPRSRFGELLFGALQDAGYVMRIGADGGDALDYVIERADEGDAARADEGDTWTFLVSAGTVKLKRDYAVDAAGIRPVSRMLLHGADASAVVIDHTRFERAGASAGEDPRGAVAGGARPSPPVGSAAASAPDLATATVPRAVPVTAPRARARPAPRTNMYDTRRSAFAPILARYETLDRHVMVFGDDSLVMGADNKRAAREIAARFDAATDVLSLIGCSHGRTALANGNETLALGRAARVKEEFLLAGLDAELVLDEGCWAGQHFDEMPARGVVVTHKRRGDA